MADKKINITLDIGANISQVKSAINTLRGDFEKLGFDKGTTNIQNLFKNLDSALLDLEKKSNTALTGLSDAKGVERSIERVTGLIRTLGTEITELSGKTPEALSSMVDGFSSKMKQAGEEATNYNKRIKEIDDSYKNLTSDVSKIGKRITGFTEKIAEEEVKLKEETKAVAEAFEKLNNLQTKKSGIQKQIQGLNSDLDKQKQKLLEYATDLSLKLNSTGTALTTASKQALTDLGDEGISQTFQQVEANITRLTGQIKDLEEENGRLASSIKTATSEYNKLKGQQSRTDLSIKTDKGQLELAKKRLQELQQAMEEFNASSEKTEAFEEYKNKLSQIFGDETLKNAKNVEELRQRLQQLSQTIGVELKSGLEQVLSSLKQTSPELEKAGDKARGVVQEYKGFNEANHEIEMLTSRLKYFFSLIGGFQLMRRAVRSAIETTKELDEVMTQTAVVSNYTVGDMWKTLPQYSKYAKQLGAEIKDVYSAQTLYVQQGLNMNAAMDLGIETLKMARVAGIEASEATNSMTAALRGFNMELTETSAIRINDVYSKLAQNTASNVQEISTAMTKTAALANSANMSFENTAAYLAKIIESTREGAETAGTALKTVIARFTEVKKLYSEGELTGTDEEGEEIDVNKISAALRTVGINMNEFFTGAVGLDDIFDQLGQKWGSLTTVQQRYIATMAAGSRQQSRFLALMQNYNRTVELTEMAYNSAGSGQEQFEKTLESLGVKINQLKAAWDTFTMGIANSDFIKGAIDAGTTILELLNSIIDKISGGNGAVKSVLSLATAFGVFKAGGAIVKGGLGKIGTLIGTKAGADAGESFLSNFKQALKTQNFSQIKLNFTDFFNKNINWKQTDSNILKNSEYQKKVRESFLDDVEKSDLTDLQKLNLQLTYDSKGLDEAKEKAKNLGVTFENTDKTLNLFKTNMNAVGNSCLLAGSALLVFTNYLKNAGIISGETVKILESISTALIVFGATLKITQFAISIFAKSATVSISSIPIIGWIAAVIAALTALSIALYNAFSLETQANEAKEFADQAAQAAENAKTEFKQLQDSIEEINSKQDIFNELIKGTEEWDTAVQDLNQSILELLKVYPALASAVEYVDGHLSLDTRSQEYKDWLEQEREKTRNAAIASESASRRNLIKEKEIDIEKIASKSLYGRNRIMSIYKNGLFSILSSAELEEHSINQLLEGIYSGAITDLNSLKLWLEHNRTINDNQKEIIISTFTDTQKSWDDERQEYVSTTIDFTKDIIHTELIRHNQDDVSAILQSFSNGLTYALEKAGYNKSQYANMYRLLAAQEFQKIYSKNQPISDEIKELYSRTYVAGLYGKENADEISDQQYEDFLREQQTIVNVFNGEDITNFIKTFNSLNKDEQAQISALITGETEQLTLSQLRGLENFNYYDLVESRSKISKKTAIGLYDELFEGFEDFQGQLEQVSDTVDQVKNYEKAIEIIQRNGGDVELFFQQISEILKNTDPEKASKVKEILSAIDFSDRSSIRNGIKQIQELGVVIDDNLTNSIIGATKAIAKFNLKTLEEQIKTLESSKSTAEKLTQGERKFSLEEYSNLSSIVQLNTKDWIRTGFDEYTYIGEETNNILSNIDTAVNEIVAETKQQLNEDIAVGNKIATLISNNARIYRGDSDQKGITIEQAVDMVSQGVANEVVLGQLRRIFGLGATASSEAILDYFQKYLDLEGNTQKYLSYQTYEEIGYNQSSAQYLLSQAAAGEETASRALEGQVISNDLSLAVEDYTKKLKAANKNTQDYKDSLNALAIIANKAEINIGNLNDVLSNEFQTLKSAKEGTTAYNDAMIKILKAAKAVFGNDITSQWIKDNIELFYALSKGGDEAEAAFKTLSQIRAKEVLKQIGNESEILGEKLGIIQANWDALDGSTLEVGAVMDLGGLIADMNLTEQEAEELAKYLNNIPDLSVVWNPGDKNTPPQLTVKKIGASGIGIPTKTGGGGKDFENDFDKYYNKVEDINELQRLRNLLETDYQQLLNSEEISGKAIYDNLKRQVELLKERRDITADLAEKRKQQIIDEVAANQDLQKYAWWNDADQIIEINWDLINTVKDSEQGSNIKDYVSKLEGFQSKYDEQIEALEEIETTLKEIEKRGREQYTSLEDRVRDALIKQIQDKIDELNSVNESINDTNQKLFDSIQETLELQRQTRDNAKTEENLADKEQRLAYLRQDSSNANALEIAKLEEELADERQSYTDTLIDQKISELQKQNEKAQEQRQQQIDLMQQSLDWQEKSGLFWQEAYSLIQEGTSVTGQLVHGSELESLLKGGEAWDTLSQEGKMKWLEELENTVAQAAAFISSSRQLETIGTKEGSTITFTDKAGKVYTGQVDSKGNVVVGNEDGTSTIWKGVYQNYDGTFHTFEDEGETRAINQLATSTKQTAVENKESIKNQKLPIKNYRIGYDTVWAHPSKDEQNGIYTKEEAEKKAKELNDEVENKLRAENENLSSLLKNKAIFDDSDRNSIKEKIKANRDLISYRQVKGYKTGGLNTQTGPAWLDGTPSKPELVLNAEDTKNFIQLKDTLADVRKNNKSLGSNGGDNYYDIDIEVKEISSDYDVDQMATRVKTLIVQDGASRKVNTLSRLR